VFSVKLPDIYSIR